MNALLRIVAWTLAVALVLLPVVALLNGWIASERWPLRTLRVQGALHNVDEQQLRATVLPFARRGFFAVRLEDAQAAVAKLPWVERAEVRKHWPDVLEVHVIEHRPFARWGTDRLLSEHGSLFPVKGIRVPSTLPQLGGPDARVHDVVALYNESRVLFASTGQDVRALRLDARGSWSLTLAGGAVAGPANAGTAPTSTEVVVGRSDARPRLSRFARLLPQLLAQPQRFLRRADLRYTNGFALQWADVAAAPTPAVRTTTSQGNT